MSMQNEDPVKPEEKSSSSNFIFQHNIWIQNIKYKLD